VLIATPERLSDVKIWREDSAGTWSCVWTLPNTAGVDAHSGGYLYQDTLAHVSGSLVLAAMNTSVRLIECDGWFLVISGWTLT
jgi:hypothetical protein